MTQSAPAFASGSPAPSRSATVQPPSAHPHPANTPSARSYVILAVDRALDVVEALARTAPSTLTRVASEAGCTRTAAFRLLRTLEVRGFAVQEDRGTWRLGPRWAVLSRGARDPQALAIVARPHLAALAQACGENVFLRVREGLASRTIAHAQAEPDLPTFETRDGVGPLHVESGRLLLAYAPEPVRAQALARKLPRYTSSTRTDPAWIADDLPRIRQRGWLLTMDEGTQGLVVLAAPVRDGAGEVAAALVIAASGIRLRGRRARGLLPVLLEAAAGLSHALGAR